TRQNVSLAALRLDGPLVIRQTMRAVTSTNQAGLWPPARHLETSLARAACTTTPEATPARHIREYWPEKQPAPAGPGAKRSQAVHPAATLLPNRPVITLA